MQECFDTNVVLFIVCNTSCAKIIYLVPSCCDTDSDKSMAMKREKTSCKEVDVRRRAGLSLSEGAKSQTRNSKGLCSMLRARKDRKKKKKKKEQYKRGLSE